MAARKLKDSARGERVLSAIVVVLISFAIFCAFSLAYVVNNGFGIFFGAEGWRAIPLFIAVLLFDFVNVYVIMNQRLADAFKLEVLALSTICITALIGSGIELYLGTYARPMALGGVLVAVLINKRTAYFTHIVTCLFEMMFDIFFYGVSSACIVPALTDITAGVIMIMLIALDDSRLKSLVTTLKSVLIFACIFYLYYLIFDLQDDLIFGLTMIQVCMSPLFAGFLYLGILPLYESVFNIVTPYRLTELTDITKGLLHELAEKAPGTFNHSLSVANLSAACANAIGEDARLARACAYYHDIGKIYNPKLFTENQQPSEENPHDKLTPELSVNLIKKHVSNGVEILKNAHMPEPFVAAAAEHHGTLPIKYFYAKAKKYTEGYLDIADYSHDGPIPSTKVSAIIMIADASEAAVRTVTDRTRSKIDEIIRDIIEERMELEQFNDCKLTFKDLQVIRTTLVDNFAGLYHDRIQYPKFKITRESKSSNEDKQQ